MSTRITLKRMDAHKGSNVNEHYDKCMIGQMKAKLFPLQQPTNRRSKRPFEMIHMDLLTTLESALDGYYKYLLVIVDDYTWYAWVYGL